MPETSHIAYGAASHVAAEVDSVFLFILIIAAFFFITTQGALIYLALRYRKKKGEPERQTAYITKNTVLEGLWIGLPSLAVFAIFLYGYTVWEDLRTVPEGAEEINVLARQWLYEFKYADGRKYVNEVRVPVGQTVKFTMTSADVLHGFFIPSYRVKQDILPGRYTYVWLKAETPGDFYIFCTQYCGYGHSQMRATLKVMPGDQYQAWYLKETSKPTAGLPLAEEGRAVVLKLGCLACHSTDGTVKVGPTWEDLYGSRVLLEGGNTVAADDNYIRESILEPGAKIVKGFSNIMPTFKGVITEDEITAVIAYIRSLSPKGMAAPTARLAAPAAPPSAAKGKEAVEKNGCLACHSTDGSKKVGPTWKGLYGAKVTLADGRVMTADDQYIKEHIYDPSTLLVKGFPNIMPSYKGIISDDDVASITEYIKTLK
ncbi:MAG: cytochrome c oxidase subunit II [Nitrospirota bacterium]